MMCVPVSIADILGQVESSGWREKQNVSRGNTTPGLKLMYFSGSRLGQVFTTSPLPSAPKYLVYLAND